MLAAIRLRLIYTAHMLAPLPFVRWHLSRLDRDTIAALVRFTGARAPEIPRREERENANP